MSEQVEVDAEPTGVTAELLDRLRPHLKESLMVLDADWMVLANLAPPGGLIGRGLGLGLHTLEDMHPDDALQVMELGIEAFSTEPGWTGSQVVRMRTGEGSYGRYEITAINCFDDPVIAGMVVRTRELPQEVSESWEGERPLSAIATLAELLPIGVLMMDRHGRVVFANDTACGMLGREPEALKRDGLLDAVADGDRSLVDDVLRRAGRMAGKEEATVDIAGGRAGRVEMRVTSEGTDVVTCIVIAIEDVTERDAARRALDFRANHDPLTGLLNRAAVHDVLEACITDAAATAVAYLDLDGFKQVNDTWGHERGDELLVAVGAALRHGLGPEVAVGRIGGDEFVVVAPEDEGRAEDSDQSFAYFLRGMVASVAQREQLPVSCSVGVSHLRVGDTGREVLRRADQAMYHAKGRRP